LRAENTDFAGILKDQTEDQHIANAHWCMVVVVLVYGISWGLERFGRPLLLRQLLRIIRIYLLSSSLPPVSSLSLLPLALPPILQSVLCIVL
jgi:hypothetical protein